MVLQAGALAANFLYIVFYKLFVFGLPQRSVPGNKLLLKAATQVPSAEENRKS